MENKSREKSVVKRLLCSMLCGIMILGSTSIVSAAASYDSIEFTQAEDTDPYLVVDSDDTLKGYIDMSEFEMYALKLKNGGYYTTELSRYHYYSWNFSEYMYDHIGSDEEIIFASIYYYSLHPDEFDMEFSLKKGRVIINQPDVEISELRSEFRSYIKTITDAAEGGRLSIRCSVVKNDKEMISLVCTDTDPWGNSSNKNNVYIESSQAVDYLYAALQEAQKDKEATFDVQNQSYSLTPQNSTIKVVSDFKLIQHQLPYEDEPSRDIFFAYQFVDSGDMNYVISNNSYDFSDNPFSIGESSNGTLSLESDIFSYKKELSSGKLKYTITDPFQYDYKDADSSDKNAYLQKGSLLMNTSEKYIGNILADDGMILSMPKGAVDDIMYNLTIYMDVDGDGVYDDSTESSFGSLSIPSDSSEADIKVNMISGLLIDSYMSDPGDLFVVDSIIADNEDETITVNCSLLSNKTSVAKVTAAKDSTYSVTVPKKMSLSKDTYSFSQIYDDDNLLLTDDNKEQLLNNNVTFMTVKGDLAGGDEIYISVSEPATPQSADSRSSSTMETGVLKQNGKENILFDTAFIAKTSTTITDLANESVLEFMNFDSLFESGYQIIDSDTLVSGDSYSIPIIIIPEKNLTSGKWIGQCGFNIKFEPFKPAI